MGRHFHLRDARILVAVAAAVLLIMLGAMVGLAVGGSKGTPVASGSVQGQEAAQMAGAEAGTVSEGEPARAASASAIASEEGAAEQGKGESEPEPEPLDAHGLSAGTSLTEDDIARAGGTDAFFWVEPIPDDVFARMEGKSYGADCTVPLDDLRYVRVLHVTAEGVPTVGELVVNRNVADEVLAIFRELYEARYPIRKMHLVDDYGASDDASISDDNTSSFNYRLIAGTYQLSNHAFGLAIDINPFENPYINRQGNVVPPEAWPFTDRTSNDPYVLHEGDLCFSLFTSHGWSWGGYWASPIDYQHFEKPGAY